MGGSCFIMPSFLSRVSDGASYISHFALFRPSRPSAATPRPPVLSVLMRDSLNRVRRVFGPFNLDFNLPSDGQFMIYFPAEVKMDTLIITGWGWKEYAVAAAIALRAVKGQAEVMG